MIKLKRKVTEKAQYCCFLCSLNEEETETAKRLEFKDNGGVEIKIPLCTKHFSCSSTEISKAINKVLCPDDGQMKFVNEEDE